MHPVAGASGTVIPDAMARAGRIYRALQAGVSLPYRDWEALPAFVAEDLLDIHHAVLSRPRDSLA